MKRLTTTAQLHTRPETRSRRARPRRARAFTMVEILVVIGILLVLVGIAAVALKGLDQSGRATKGTLHNLRNMLAEYESAAGLRTQPPGGLWRNNSHPAATATPPPNIWKERANIEGVAQADRGIVTVDSPERVTWDAVCNTQLVYQILNRIPSNRQAMGKLPRQQLLGQVDVSPPPPRKLLPLPGSDPVTIDPPLVLDAWGNPIVFVGSDGLRMAGVDKKPGTPGTSIPDFNRLVRVTSVGLVAPDDPTPAGARPFFASAGPDGNFRTHEDNVYSFEE